MKLYTEEQVRQAIELTYLVELYGTRDIKYRHTPDEVVEKLTPIEIPNDEKIYNASPQHYDGTEYSTGEHHGFMKGAKWMRDKILNK